MKKLAISIFALVMAASMALASSVSQFKAGDISFSVMDKDGATPMQAASIQMLGSEDGAVVAETSTDELGQAVMAVDEGRYVMRVNDINLVLFEVGSEGTSVCRVIMPDASLLAGGQDQEDDNDKEGATVSEGAVAAGAGAGAAESGTVLSSKVLWTVVGGVVVAGVIVGTGVIIDNNTHHNHHDDADASATQTPTSSKSKSSKSPSAI